MKHFLPQHNLPEMIELLSFLGDVFAPGRDDSGVARFAPCNSGNVPDLSILRTMLPPKKLLLHPSDIVAHYSAGSGYRSAEHEVKPWILLAVHPCDLAGIAYLDRLMLGENHDSLYASRRKAMTLIGLSCTPDEFCSCGQSECNLPAPCDLFLHVVDNGWNITLHTDRGAELMQRLQPLLEQRDCKNNADTLGFFGHAGKKRKEPDWEHPAWQVLADKCIGCGACSVTCPTCSCFDIQEFGSLNSETVKRIRSWDSCLLASHSRVAGAFSFQKNRRERFKYRYRHKYLGFGEMRGVVSCTGCGRCRAFCPAGIDLRELARVICHE